ncbi:hypothetical protein HQ496_13400 [bacterium]|nr:hypothetical protein [bacterium]
MKIKWLILACCIGLSACDHGLEPPAFSGTGRIEGTIEYVGNWPSPDSLDDLRFVGMRFIPKDTSDFLQLNQMVISQGLQRNVDSDSFVIEDAATGFYVYSGVAQKFDSDLLSWRPVGLYTDDAGVFSVAPNQTTEIRLQVDFNHLPIFPPTQ